MSAIPRGSLAAAAFEDQRLFTHRNMERSGTIRAEGQSVCCRCVDHLPINLKPTAKHARVPVEPNPPPRMSVVSGEW